MSQHDHDTSAAPPATTPASTARRRLLAGGRRCRARRARRAGDRARAGGAEDPHRLLADRGRPAVLRRDREGLLQGSRPRRRAAQVRRRAAGDGGDALRPLRRQLQRHRLGQPRDRRDRAAGPLQDLLHQPEQREERARRVHRAQGQPGQDDGRPEGQARRLRPRHPERDAGQDDARARRRHRRHGDRAADRPARRGDRRRPGRRRLHARADRHHRPHERHARACSKPA